MAITYSKLGQNGRLCNSLFQMAAVIALAVRNNDTYLFPRWKYEEYFPNLKNCFVDNLPKQPHAYTEPYFHYKEIPYKKDMDLSGYFQSFRYFNDYRDLIIKLLEFKTKLPELIGTTAIHVRRGDYISLGNEYYVDLIKTDYYQQAMDIIKSPKYLIVSDDIEFCKKIFI